MRGQLLVLAILVCSACTNPRTGKPAPVIDTVTLRTMPSAEGPRVLCVVAHPDDETTFAATLYKTASYLDGACDIMVVTNGEGGFKYSTLAEDVYGVELTEECVGRRHLPAIRRQEFLAGCEIMQVRRAYFLNQWDHRYTQDANEVLGKEAAVWNLIQVKKAIASVLWNGAYDFVFTMVPSTTTHGHHQAATLLTLGVLATLPEERRPLILAAATQEQDVAADHEVTCNLLGDPLAAIDPEPIFEFDRMQTFGFKNRLNYQIIVNWVIACHKSQGSMQLAMNRAAVEQFYSFALNDSAKLAEFERYFTRLQEPQFETRTYGASAGTNVPSSSP